MDDVKRQLCLIQRLSKPFTFYYSSLPAVLMGISFWSNSKSGDPFCLRQSFSVAIFIFIFPRSYFITFIFFQVFTQEEEQDPQDQQDHLSDIKEDLVDEGDNTRPSSNGEVI